MRRCSRSLAPPPSSTPSSPSHRHRRRPGVTCLARQCPPVLFGGFFFFFLPSCFSPPPTSSLLLPRCGGGGGTALTLGSTESTRSPAPLPADAWQMDRGKILPRFPALRGLVDAEGSLTALRRRAARWRRRPGQLLLSHQCTVEGDRCAPPPGAGRTNSTTGGAVWCCRTLEPPPGAVAVGRRAVDVVSGARGGGALERG